MEIQEEIERCVNWCANIALLLGLWFLVLFVVVGPTNFIDIKTIDTPNKNSTIVPIAESEFTKPSPPINETIEITINRATERLYKATDNESDLRTVSPLPVVEDTVGTLTNKTTFVKSVFGTPCVQDDDCGRILKCTGQSDYWNLKMTCECPYNDDQVYKETIGDPRCVWKIGSSCHLRDDCVDNANCTLIDATKNNVFRCECKPGYVENDERGCDLAFGSPCNNSTPCDQSAGLACREGKCSCKNPNLVFEPEWKCVTPEGGSCTLSTECGTSIICYKSLRRNSKWGRCTHYSNIKFD